MLTNVRPEPAFHGRISSASARRTLTESAVSHRSSSGVTRRASQTPAIHLGTRSRYLRVMCRIFEWLMEWLIRLADFTSVSGARPKDQAPEPTLQPSRLSGSLHPASLQCNRLEQKNGGLRRDSFFGAMEGADREMEPVGTRAHRHWNSERFMGKPQGGDGDDKLRHRWLTRMLRHTQGHVETVF